VTIDLGAARAPSARAASSTFDDDPFARNDGARVLDRVKTSGTAATTTDEGRAKPGVSTETEAAKDETVRDEAVRGAAAAPEAAPGPEAVSKPAAPKPAPPRVTESSTKVDTKALLNNTRIKTYNNAPVDFPAFLREGYDVKVIHGNDYTVREDGLIVKDYLIGEGESPKDNQECTFNYVAYNENGGTIDSTYRRGAPASTRLGINGMIPGFELGIKDMRPGGKRRIIVPPELGPPTGPATFFSAKQWEVFDIELLDVKSCSRAGGLGSFGSNIVCE
jgi:FKBP-type peptidyl-prolyl cis-trans isomerase